MQDKWIITRIVYKKQPGKEQEKEGTPFLLMAHFTDGKAVELYVEEDCHPLQKDASLGNVYIGKVARVVKNIEAAFVEICNKQMCYYSLKENRNPIYTNVKTGTKLAVGDELLVQLTREKMKTKESTVSSNINLSGRYVVLVHGSNHIGISAKLSAKEKERLRSLVAPLAEENFGFIVRTNAAGAPEEAVLEEAEALIAEYRLLLQTARHRPAFSCLKSHPPLYCKKLKDIYFTEETELVTDQEDIFRDLQETLQESMPEMEGRLRLYQDALLPLGKLYSLESLLSDGLKERVWLKSGGYLIIQPTEALTVIDVNSGKFDGKKKKEETFLKINMEAATEIARQLKLRNLSGMILVDFINQKDKEMERKFLQLLREELRKDPVKASLVDITQLGLVEITRKKVQKPLYEQLGMRCPCCHGAGYIY